MELKYHKTSGNRELLNPTGTESSDELPFSQESVQISSTEPNAYSKPEGVNTPRLLFIYVEGEKKEVVYFKHFQKRNYVNRLRLITFPMSNRAKYKGNLVSKITKALKEAEETGIINYKNEPIHLSDIDSIFVVVDVDELYGQILAARADTNLASWIISNPCFEMWLYYAFHSNPSADLMLEELETAKRSQELKRKLDLIHPGGIGCRDAVENIENACKNSLANYAIDEHNIPKLYSTDMHLLAKEIYEAIKNEFHNIQQQRKNQILKFRQTNGPI